MNSDDKLWELKKLEYKQDELEEDIARLSTEIEIDHIRGSNFEMSTIINNHVFSKDPPCRDEMKAMLDKIDWSTKYDDDMKAKREELGTINAQISELLKD